MKEYSLTIGGRKFPLAFTLNTMLRMQEEVDGFNFDNMGEYISTAGGLVTIMYYMAASGAALENQKLDVSRTWMAERIPVNPKRIEQIRDAVIGAITDGMKMEAEEAENEDREVDVVLEDIKKKDGKTG